MNTRQTILENIKRHFENHKATLVLDNENIAVIDWRNKNGSSVYYIRYIIDKILGSIIIQGDLGFATACWYGKNNLHNFYSYMSDIGYFASKLVCYTDKYTYNEEDIREDVKEEQELLISREKMLPEKAAKTRKAFSSIAEDIIECRQENTPYTDDIIRKIEKRINEN